MEVRISGYPEDLVGYVDIEHNSIDVYGNWMPGDYRRIADAARKALKTTQKFAVLHWNGTTGESVRTVC